MLDQVDVPSLLAALPTDELEAGHLIAHGANHIIGGPREYLLIHFDALCDFYLDAAKCPRTLGCQSGVRSVLGRP
ncbi:hypothetical protein ACWDR2_30960 [Streptomyces sp. NPDC003631]|uniref:hypothetical protein n=1 Tax=unclassified Streptomyces TaxID=2593676 RepID=UPI002ECE6BA5|nr:hypothetical protein [Streptomyces sp. WAC07094]